MTARLLRVLSLFAFVALVGCTTRVTSTLTPPTTAPKGPPPKVELAEVTIAGLEAAIKENSGKVVLVDVWFLGCGPCVKKFPSFVELHKKYADQGLVCMSLDVLPDEIPEKDKVLAFLTKQGASFPNFIVKDTDSNLVAWQARHDAEWTPSIVLFGRNGEWIKTPKNVTAEELETIVKEVLNGK